MKTGVSYFGNRMAEHYAARDLPEIVTAGCTYVVHTLSEEDVRHYAGSVRAMVEATRAAGLEAWVDPWGVGGLFAGEAASTFLTEHPEAWQVSAQGERVPAACPNHPATQRLLDAWLDAALAVKPDGIFWDDPHWWVAPGGSWTCRCAACRDRYRAWAGSPMPDALTRQVAAFRQDSVCAFVGRLAARAKAAGVRNAFGLLPFMPVALPALDSRPPVRAAPGLGPARAPGRPGGQAGDAAHTFVDWRAVAALPGVDVVALSPFPRLFGGDGAAYVRRWCERLVTLCQAHGKEPMVWLQAFQLPAGAEEEVRTAAQAAYDAGVRNVAVWGFRGCAHMTSLRCERPDVVWRVTGDTFSALRRHAQ